MLVIANVDNIAGEEVPYIIEELMKLGAGSVHAIPAMTKKGRPEFIFLIDTTRENVEALGDFMVSEMGILGLRLFEEAKHIKFNYEMRKVKIALQGKASGQEALSLIVDVKLTRNSQGLIASAKPEYQELRAGVDALAKANVNISLPALKEMIETFVLNKEVKSYQTLSLEFIDG
jgi:uncharacterized protein (DUF111 family)